MNYLDELNEVQRQAVVHIDGPTMVIAGAGSGKTRVLTYRIAHLIKNGIDPFNILALTFTNKAAREMKNRISKIVGESEGKNIWMGTFHSVFAKILRYEADKLNYTSNFTIYDTQDSRSVLKDIIKSFQLDDKMYKPAAVQNRISSAKNNLISPQAYAQNTDLVSEDRQTGKHRMAEIYLAYTMRCKRAGAMDFDDLLFNMNVLLKKYPEILLKYQHKFKYILVDEYQDTNFSQYYIVKQLAALNRNICVVGDDAQSIYAFRGADIQNILNFEKDYPEYRLFKLEQNYRSTQNIVNAANSIIANNKNQIPKVVWTSNDEGQKVTVKNLITDNDEGAYVVNTIFETKNNKQAKNSDFAILYRTNAQSRAFEESLRKLNIKYKIYGGLSFYQRKEVKDLLAYFRLTANPNDDEAFKRIINYPRRGIGNTTLDKINIAANNNNVSYWEVCNNLYEYKVQVSQSIATKLKQFNLAIRSFASELDRSPAYDLAQKIATSSGILKNLYEDRTPEGVARYDNIQELLNGVKLFTEEGTANNDEKPRTLTDFLLDVALLTDPDKDEDDPNKVSLMTIHSAKGLEFPYVFVVGLEENLFPSQMALHSRTELEEERRLFYVAITRAEKHAFLSYAQLRYKWGNVQNCEPSRFIDEIDEQYLELPSQPPKRRGMVPDFSKARSGYFKKSTPVKQKIPENMKKLSQVSKNAKPASDNSLLQAGMEVKHDRFGKGKVLKIEGNNPNKKAVVFFPKVGQKQLLLRFAKLEIL